ncbi:MAG TPA: DUF4412 domain-containing protein [Salinimicrobium sp.]|nr:DUF4412 domain-containing protein [Salinimicrobium sp.]
MKKIIYILVVVLGCSFSAQAQFFKKLKEKVEKKVENAVTESVSDKAEKETQKAMDKMLEANLSNISMGMESADLSEVPETYTFNWEYALHMKTKDGDFEMIYRLNEDQPYIGIEMPQAEGMFMVMDQENKLMAMFMNSQGNKFLTATKLPEVPEEVTDEEEINSTPEITKIGTKTILGYESQGYQTEDEDHIITFYVTDEAGISFNDMFKTSQKNMPKNFEAEWLEEGALLMEMNMQSKTNPKETMLMTCTRIEKEDFSIKKADYASVSGK